MRFNLKLRWNETDSLRAKYRRKKAVLAWNRRRTRNFLNLLLVSFGGALVAMPAIADQTAGPDRNAAIDCSQMQIQGEATRCAARAFDAARVELEAIYRELYRRYDAPNRILLKASQDRWVRYRDGECAFENAPTAGGSIHPQLIAECLTRETKLRIAILDAQRSCDIDAGLGCNAPNRH